MDAEDIRSDMEETRSFLIRVSNRLTSYLDEYNPRVIKEENQGVLESKEYIGQVFKQLRRMEVLFEEGLYRLDYILKDEKLSQMTAEKTLFKIYHQCVMEFYSPGNDTWFEESRALYTEQASILFREKVPLVLKKLFAELEPDFQYVREILDYYDTKHQASFM